MQRVTFLYSEHCSPCAGQKDQDPQHVSDFISSGNKLWTGVHTAAHYHTPLNNSGDSTTQLSQPSYVVGQQDNTITPVLHSSETVKLTLKGTLRSLTVPVTDERWHTLWCHVHTPWQHSMAMVLHGDTLRYMVYHIP